MTISILKKMLIVTLSLMLTRVPQLQAAVEAVNSAEGKMISTIEWVNEQSRKDMVDKVTQFMGREDVANQLTAHGVSPNEAQMRVASLSDAELQHLSSEIDKATYGGSVAGVLIVVLLVVLIIYLVKRI